MRIFCNRLKNQNNQQKEMENKDGFVIVQAGGTGSGKTTATKKIISIFKDKKPFFIYDIDAEYLEYYRKPYKPLNDFFDEVVKVKNSVVVFEESALFFEHGRANTDLKEMIICARRRGNVIVFNFHQLRQIPVYILGYSNFLIVRKTTGDSVKRFKEMEMADIVNAHESVKRNPNYYYSESVNLCLRVK